MFKILASALTLALASAFSTTTTTTTTTLHRATTTQLHYHPQEFDRAVDCANNYGMCDVDELLNLAAELENYQGCFYEKDEVTCEKEMDDRKDLADILQLQGELLERTRYLKEGNLFAYDVKEDTNMHDRDAFMENVEPAMDL